MSSKTTNATAAPSPGWSSAPQGSPSACHSASTNMLAQQEQNRLQWLDLHTRPASVRAALITLRTEALSDNAHSALAGRFLLWLWHHGNSPLDPSDLAYLDQALNFAVRHLLNFTIATQVDLRQLLTASEMAPVLAAWGENTHG